MIFCYICLPWLFLLLWYFGPMFKANNFDNISDETFEKQTIKPGSFLDKLYIFRNTTPKLKLVAIMFVVFFFLTLICTCLESILYFALDIANKSVVVSIIFACNLGIEMAFGGVTILYLNFKGNYVMKRFLTGNVYKRIQTDFSFINTYGYRYDQILESCVVPSVVFCSTDKKILIGMSFEKNRIFIFCYEDLNSLYPIDLLGDFKFNSKRYKNQTEIAKSILKNFLEKNS